MSTTSYFVYYKVNPERLDELRERVSGLFREIERATGVKGRWMRRRDDANTCMEIYEGVGDGARFESLLEHEVARLGLDRGLADGTTRHTETFVHQGLDADAPDACA